jgi:ketosteroid isomerase-like protein
MADLTPLIETMEHRWMRAWVAGDHKQLKALTSRDFTLLLGGRPAAILDRLSWLEAATSRYLCTSYRFGDVHVRDLGGVAVFASQLEIKATMDGRDWSGQLWVTDLWRKGRVRRSWRLAERIISRPDESKDVVAGIRSLQLWR